MNIFHKFLVFTILTFPFCAKSQNDTLKFVSLIDNLSIENLKVIAKNNDSKYLIIINSAVYIPDIDCLPQRNLGGMSDNRNLGGGTDNRDLQGSDNERNSGSGFDDRNLGGGINDRDLQGSNNNENFGGSADNKCFGGSIDNRNFAGSILHLYCMKLDKELGFSIINTIPSSIIFFFDGNKLSQVENNKILIIE